MLYVKSTWRCRGTKDLPLPAAVDLWRLAATMKLASLQGAALAALPAALAAHPDLLPEALAAAAAAGPDGANLHPPLPPVLSQGSHCSCNARTPNR